MLPQITFRDLPRETDVWITHQDKRVSDSRYRFVQELSEIRVPLGPDDEMLTIEEVDGAIIVCDVSEGERVVVYTRPIRKHS